MKTMIQLFAVAVALGSAQVASACDSCAAHAGKAAKKECPAGCKKKCCAEKKKCDADCKKKCCAGDKKKKAE